jgi:eukaryotic-like serine/threonine-protein kinase
MMKPERWRQVDQIFQAALERAPKERSAFINKTCGADDSLRREVEKLLAADGQAGSLIETPAYAVAAPLIAEDGLQSLAGQSVGHYQIISLLGKGGMGEVYRARDTRLERTVALKILPAEVAADKERMRRFVREAKAASALNHPNVAHIYEIGEENALSFIAMEYIEGQALAAKINGQPLTVSEVVEIGSQIADALDEAHRKGITHRDIKPANVMLNERGQVKVLDFGLAKIARPTEQPISSDISTMAKTAPGVVMGTVPYMSPEQALGRDVDHRSDLFSLGVVIYEMATGRLPFSGSSPSEILDRILHSQPEAIARFNYDVPAELERIVRKCLEKERERRYQSARELLVDLNNLKRERDSAQRNSVSAGKPVGRIKGSRWGVVLGLILVVITVVSLTYFGLQSPRQLKAPRVTPITSDGYRKGRTNSNYWMSALVNDGSRLYFVRAGFITQVSSAGGETVEIPAPFPLSRIMDILPNRSELIVSGQSGSEFEAPLMVMPILGGAARRLGDLVGHAAASSADGERIVYGQGTELYLAKSDGSNSHKLVTAPGRVQMPRWSPDGSRIRFTVQDAKTNFPSLWEVAVDGSKLHPLLEGWNQPAAECCGNWTADGQYFVFQSTRNWRTDIWVIREKAGLLGNARPEPMQLTFGPLNYTMPVPSPDGRKLFVVGEQQRGELLRYDAKTQQFVRYLAGMSADGVDLSRDGEWVTYVAYPEGSLWRSKLDGTERRQLSFPPLHAFLPRWSPDGKQIAFAATFPGKNWKIYLVSAEGGNPQPLTSEERYENDVTWTQDGNSLIFGAGSLSSATFAIYQFDLRTRRESLIPGSEGMFSPRYSPDGRYVVALRVGAATSVLYDFTTRQWVDLVNQQMGSPHWSRDGKYLYFVRGFFQGQGNFFYRLLLDERKLEQIARVKDFRLASNVWGPWYGWTPDGAPLVLRDIGTQDIYALEWQTP